MTAIILAAGYATRLYPLTENFPKPLLPIGNSTILDRLISDLETTTAIRKFIVVSNHKFAGIFQAWTEKRTGEAIVTIVDDGTSTNETRLGAAKDILFAVEQEKVNEDFLVMAGDNVLDFSLSKFVDFAKSCGTSCVMCHEENELKKQQKTAIITVDENQWITSYEEKPKEPKGNLAVPPFYYYRLQDALRIPEALEDGCSADAPGSFAAWLSKHTQMHAWKMTGKRYDIGDLISYDEAKRIFGT